MRTSASQTPPTKYQAFLEERGQLLSKNFTGTKRERQIGKILVPNTAKMDNWIPYGFEVLALKVQNEQREPPLLPGTLKETNQQSAGLVREAVYGKAASIPNRYYSLTVKGIAEAQNIGYAVAATLSAMTALILTVRWTTTLGVTTCEEPAFEAGTFYSFVSSQWFCGTITHQGLVATAAIIAAQCGIYWLPIEWVTCKFRERIKTGEPRGFYLGYIGILLNLRRVDRKKASIETQLPGITFAAFEEELGQKVQRMKKNCTSMTRKLVFTVCLMLDIARYSNQSGIALGCAAIPVNNGLGIAGAASFVTSMSRAFGVPATQYGRNRRNYRFGKHGEEEGTFTTRMETVVYVSMCAVSCEFLYLFVGASCIVLSIDFCLLQSHEFGWWQRSKRLAALGDLRSTVSKLLSHAEKVLPRAEA